VVGGTWENDEAFVVFSSFARAPTVYRYRVSDGDEEVWAELDAPVSPDDFVVTQVRYPSTDGTMIPMFLAHRRGIVLDGSNRTLLTGYGGFNVSMMPSFNRMAVAWMEQGGVWALPSLRGGGEFGEAWHRAGMLANKQNVFEDFIAAADWLVASGYTRPQHLAIMGGSNGGLLVGAAMTQRPDLFAAVVCTYPLLDMLRYHRFLVARYWVPEYGSAEDPVQFEYLASYSPYQHVVRGTRYPAVMLVSGDGDTRVAPLHARKMTALLQFATASSAPVVLLYDTSAGHSSGRPISAIIDEQTAELRFLLWQTQ
jgi:prolyl oligopeptidase